MNASSLKIFFLIGVIICSNKNIVGQSFINASDSSTAWFDNRYIWVHNFFELLTFSTDFNQAKTVYETTLKTKENLAKIIDDLKLKDPEFKAKDAFETTQEYTERINRANSKYDSIYKQSIDTHTHIKDSIENLNFPIPLRNFSITLDSSLYDADKGQWIISFSTPQNKSKTTLLIDPVSARLLWNNRHYLKYYYLASLNKSSTPKIFIPIGNINFEKFVILDKFYLDPNDKKTRDFNPTQINLTDAAYEGNWFAFLQSNLNTELPTENGASPGSYTVVVRFIVSRDGSISDIVAETDPGYGLAAEAIRVIKKSKKWRPSILYGREIRRYKRQPITWLVQ